MNEPISTDLAVFFFDLASAWRGMIARVRLSRDRLTVETFHLPKAFRFSGEIVDQLEGTVLLTSLINRVTACSLYGQYLTKPYIGHHPTSSVVGRQMLDWCF